MSAPVNSVAPAISGTAAVGATLTLSDGTWAGAVSFAYAWLRGASVVEGETANTYQVALADISFSITGRVTASNVDGDTAHLSAASALVSSLDDPFADPARRAAVEAMLSSIDGAIATAVESGKVEYEINTGGGSGRRMRFSTLSELFAARDRLRAELRAIIQAQRAGAGLVSNRVTYFRPHRV